MSTVTLPRFELVTRSRAIVDVPNYGRVNVSSLLVSGDKNTKLAKNRGYGFDTVGFAMSPHVSPHVSGNVCPHASKACAAACLNVTGLGAVFSSIQAGRLARRILWQGARQWFLSKLHCELTAAERRAAKRGNRLAARLNVFSDIPWERYEIIDQHPSVEFYDYSKNPRRIGKVRPNYWTTFSRSETNDNDAYALLLARRNVAVVFHNVSGYCGNRAHLQQLPRSWRGFDVIDGDKTDLRFADTRGRSRGGKVIGLRLKAPNLRQRQGAIDSGFSVEV